MLKFYRKIKLVCLSLLVILTYPGIVIANTQTPTLFNFYIENNTASTIQVAGIFPDISYYQTPPTDISMGVTSGFSFNSVVPGNTGKAGLSGPPYSAHVIYTMANDLYQRKCQFNYYTNGAGSCLAWAGQISGTAAITCQVCEPITYDATTNSCTMGFSMGAACHPYTVSR